MPNPPATQPLGDPGIERRFLLVDDASTLPVPDIAERIVRVERRATPGVGGSPRAGKRDWIVGYAAVFSVLSREITDDNGFKFVERIAPGAFSIVEERRGRRRPLETRALFDHQTWLPLAKYPKSLGLFVDEIGLRYEFPVPRTTYGRDCANNVQDEIVTGSSFTFKVIPGGDTWTSENGIRVRTILSIDNLFDVGPVTFEAYPQATAMVAQRSWTAFQQQQQQRSGGVSASPAVPRRSDGIREYLRSHGRTIG